MAPTPPFPPLESGAIEQELQAALPALFGAGLSAKEVRKAFGHQTFLVQANDGRSYLLKIPRTAPEVARLEAVARSVALARSGGVRTPEVAHVAPAALRFGSRPYLIQEYLMGRDAEEAWPALDEPARTTILADWGREIARLHSITGDVFTEGTVNPAQEHDWAAHVLQRLERVLRYNHKPGVLTPRELETAEEKIRDLLKSCAAEVRPVLTHRDLCLRNVLLSPAGEFSALLDFEHSRFSDPVLDFVKPWLGVFEKAPKLEAAFRAGYRAEKPAAWPHENQRFEIALLLELLGEIPFHSRNAARSDLDRAVARLRATIA